jgi:hypothetical protein
VGYRDCIARRYDKAALEALAKPDLAGWQALELRNASVGNNAAAERLCAAWRDGRVERGSLSVDAGALRQSPTQAAQLCDRVTASALRAQHEYEADVAKRAALEAELLGK